MQIQQDFIYSLSTDQYDLLEKVRARRNFNPRLYVELKVKLFTRYMDRAGLKAAVVGMSGGIDSAVVLSILARTKFRTVAISLPSIKNRGVVDQIKGKDFSRKQAEKLEVEFCHFDVNPTVETIAGTVMTALERQQGRVRVASDWAYGQLTPYARTPFFYYITTLLKEQGFPAVLVGTTNRDEGAYLGYVGKASDGMVDIQLISDLHKSEVRQVAEYLRVIPEILDATPKGDMFDGKTDEEIFGASYDAVELYMTERFGGPAADNIEKVHSYNAHKYLVGSPAVHLDLYESGVEGGWPLQFESRFFSQYRRFNRKRSDELEMEFNRLLDTQLKTDRLAVEGNSAIWRVVGILGDETPLDYFDGPYVRIKTNGLVLEQIKHS